MSDEQKPPIEVESSLIVPHGWPTEVYEQVQKGLKPQAQRSMMFETERQRNAQFIKKGLTKPGRISYDTLRRASMSVHVARICINVLKEKVTKTKWVVQPIDPLKRKNGMDDKRAEEVVSFFKKPNPNDTFRTFLDKTMEDLLVLDAVSVEKTRFPNGDLAEMHPVDAATIRPVYDEFGNQDILIPLKTVHGNEVLPVSYLQVMNNSQYGGPESGDIVAAWPKRDFLYFHMHPQSSMEGFGYGLSPIEGVLSVVANLLNADNYNSTYFEEGAFPPIILQVIGTINQRDVQAFREYMIQELTGNFHRPAIAATKGAEDLKVHNLKDLTNRDMQFMEYQVWLANLLCAAFGLSKIDIGLTDDVNRSTSENQKELSESKGYSSVLALFKEQFDEIIREDFGYDDLEFDWVAPDTIEPDVASQMYDRALKNGSLTMNEVRQKMGETPLGEWADKPAILGSEGYQPVAPDDIEESLEQQQEDAPEGEEEIKKSVEKPMYICRPVLNADEIVAWAKGQGFDTTLAESDLHVTLAFSRSPVDWSKIPLAKNKITIKGGHRTVAPLGANGAIVLKFESAELQKRWGQIIGKGASWDFASFQPHVTLSYNPMAPDNTLLAMYKGDIVLGPEVREEPNDDITFQEKNIDKAILTMDNYRVWADDRGYSQPFIYMDIMSGTGKVIKPPVAVNMHSQALEITLTQQLYNMGLNVRPVRKMSHVEVLKMLSATPSVAAEFTKYCDMTPEYDSEKWRAKFGGSRRAPYYLVTDYIDGTPFSNALLLADMKREPESYGEAIADLARLCEAEKEMVLGDRRADQYIITHDKRAYGIDYQFRGDIDRWERTKNVIDDALATAPTLQAAFRRLQAGDTGVLGKIQKMFRRGKK